MRKIWNRPSWPVWSVSTVNAQGKGNMNIATYVQAVSLEPKLMMIGLYKNTQTLANIADTKRAVLQLLPETLAPVVRICGQKSGRDIDKITRLQKRFDLKQINNLYYFTEAASYVELELQELIAVDGDHLLGICTVGKQKNLHDVPLLTTDYLREQGYIR